MNKACYHTTIIALLLLGSCFKPVYADTTTTKIKHHVLITHIWSPCYVWRSKLHQAMTEHLGQFPRPGQPVVYEEGLDRDLLGDRFENDDIAAYLPQKYAEEKLDTVRAEGKLVANLLLKIRPSLFPEVNPYLFNFAPAAFSDANYTTATTRYFFDDQQLKRRQIAENRPQAGSVVINRPPEFWKEYLSIVIAAIIVLLAMVLFIALLLLDNRRRRMAERKAMEKEAHFRVLAEHAPDAILIHDLDLDRFVDANVNAERLLACSREELLQSGPLRFHPDLGIRSKEYDEVVSRVLSNETITMERKIINAEGAELICELRLLRMPAKDRKLIGASYVDISERKRAEEALMQSEQKVRALFDHSHGFLGLLAPDGTVLETNRAWLEFTGFSVDDVLGMPLWNIPWWTHSPEHQERLRAAVQTAAKGKPVRFEATNAASDGTIHYVDFSLKPVLDESGKVVLLISEGRDITEHKELKEQLSQSQKMDSLGRLAGGIAHDFNNMLSIIMVAVELLLRKVAKGDQIHKYIEQISNAAKRSSEITRQLLAFSRKEIILPRPVNLNMLIIESTKILDRLISEDIKLAFRSSPDLWTVKLDPSQLYQILMNLLVNARDAMPNSGSLTIETANVHINGEYSDNHNVKPGDYVQLSVSDTGSGMNQKTRKRIFEPFFTTKEVGKGTGLGLATVFGIVTQNNGFIDVYSELGQGTVFKIYFPRLADEAVAAEKQTPTPITGSGTILLVEDEEMLLDTTAYMLEEIGYTVIQAQSPEAAIAICEKKDQQIDLILTDVVMPNQNGRDMVDRIEAIRPNTKVLFMSGYPADIIAQRGIVDEGMHFISKPIDMNKLNEKIRKTLATA